MTTRTTRTRSSYHRRLSPLLLSVLLLLVFAATSSSASPSPQDINYHWRQRPSSTTSTTPCPTATEPPAKARTSEYADPYDGPGIPAHMAIVCSVLLFISLFLLSISFQYFIVTMAATGFLLGAMIAWMLLTIAEPKDGYPSAPVVFVSACFGTGLLTALACMKFWKVTLYILGAFSGYVLAIFVWCWRADHILYNVYARQFTSVGFSVGGILGVQLFEYLTVNLSTSFLGAFCFVLGLDLAVQTGYVNGPRSVLDFNPHHQRKIPYVATNKVYAMLGSVLAIWLIGTIWQVWYNRGRRFGLNVVKDECVNVCCKDMK